MGIIPAMSSARDDFRKFLHARRLKYTGEREAILQTVEQFQRPFEVEELLLELRRLNLRVSRATVYRTLRHLVGAGLVNQLFFGAGKQSYYDFLGGGRGHNYVVDVETGMILPFTSPELTALCERIAKRLGYHVVGHRFQILGRRKEPSGPAPTEK